MSSVRLALAGFLTVALIGGLAANARADKPTTNKAKIVGVWEFVKSSEPKSAPPPGTTIEFTKDGKMKLVVKFEGKVIPVPEGKYTVDGDTLSVTMPGPDGKEGKTEKSKITKLTDTQLIFESDEKGKKEMIELKKAK